MTRPSALTFTLADIARLAQVSRPVASMWRKREIAGQPFPKPVAVVSGQERFDASEVAEYLAATGRGNNPEARDDLAAHAQLAVLPEVDESTTTDGLTALLCLAAATGEALGELDQAALMALADDTDPDDTLLLGEVRALGSRVPTLAAHAEALADASYSPAAAFELLLRQQVHRSLPRHANVAVRAEAQRLVASLAGALATDAGMESPLFVDVTDGSGDLLLSSAQSYAAESPPSVATVALQTRSARLVRRRLRVHDLHWVSVPVDEAGDFALPAHLGPTVHVLQLPPAGSPDLSDVEVLDAIGELIVQLADSSRVVVLGPASALTDAPLSVEADRARDAILRSDRLRAAVRLPKGLLVRSPRKALALYALGPAHAGVPVGERWTVVADVSDRSVTLGVIGDLVTDVVASMAGEDLVRGHAFRFARRVRTATLLPGRRPLVGKSTPSVRSGISPAEVGARIRELARGLESAAVTSLQVEAVEPAGGAAPPGLRTLGEAVAAGECRIVPGNRVDLADLHAPDGRPAIGVDELLGSSRFGDRRVDLLTFASSYPAARFTEPGDVVFCTTPRVAAWVDRDGGSVVVNPARVLRVVRDPDRGMPPLLADVLAADIATAGANLQRSKGSSTGSDWRRWPIRHVPGDQRAALAKTLAAIDHERDELLSRLGRLDALAVAVTAGVTAGAVKITTPPAGPAAYAAHHVHDTPASPPGSAGADEEGS